MRAGESWPPRSSSSSSLANTIPPTTAITTTATTTTTKELRVLTLIYSTYYISPVRPTIPSTPVAVVILASTTYTPARGDAAAGTTTGPAARRHPWSTMLAATALPQKQSEQN